MKPYASSISRCVSRNSAGETSTSFHLIASKPTSYGIELVPDLQVANLGSQAKFGCRVFAKRGRNDVGGPHNGKDLESQGKTTVKNRR